MNVNKGIMKFQVMIWVESSPLDVRDDQGLLQVYRSQRSTLFSTTNLKISNIVKNIQFESQNTSETPFQ